MILSLKQWVKTMGDNIFWKQVNNTQGLCARDGCTNFVSRFVLFFQKVTRRITGE